MTSLDISTTGYIPVLTCTSPDICTTVQTVYQSRCLNQFVLDVSSSIKKNRELSRHLPREFPIQVNGYHYDDSLDLAEGIPP